MSDLHHHFGRRVHVPTDLIIQRDRKQPHHEIQIPAHDYVDNREIPPGWQRDESGREWVHRDDKPESPGLGRVFEW
jgi:hypothetical protein